jgi:hypothetical protein
MDRPYSTSLTFTPKPLEVAESSIIAPIILYVFVTTNTALLQHAMQTTVATTLESTPGALAFAQSMYVNVALIAD